MRKALLTLAELLLLLTAGCGVALVLAGRYHPNFAGDPWNALSIWHRSLILTFGFGLLEAAILRIGRRREGLAFPLLVNEVRSWFGGR